MLLLADNVGLPLGTIGTSAAECAGVSVRNEGMWDPKEEKKSIEEKKHNALIKRTTHICQQMKSVKVFFFLFLHAHLTKSLHGERARRPLSAPISRISLITALMPGE